MRAVFQDAFLGRGTQSPYIAIFNYMMRFDENVPKKLPPEALAAIAPGKRLRRLNHELKCLRAELQREHGAIKRAPDADRVRYRVKQNEQRAAQKKQNRKAFKRFIEEYFVQANNELLSKQAQGISQSGLPTREVQFQQPERTRLADLFGDLNEDMPEGKIVQRKIDTINAGIAWKVELGAVPSSPSPKQEPSESSLKPRPSPTPKLSPESSQQPPVLADDSLGHASSASASPRFKEPSFPSTPNLPPPQALALQSTIERPHRDR